MKPGIIICSRSDSSRIPKKPFQLIHGKPLIHRLIDQLLPLNIPICIAVPERDKDLFIKSLQEYNSQVVLYVGDESPLHRTEKAASYYGYSHIIRITHDKIFIDKESLNECLTLFSKEDFNYIFSSHLIDGTGFEIFTYDILKKASEHFKGQYIEHLSYAIKAITPRMLNYNPRLPFPNDLRLLIDFEEDLEFIKAIYSHCYTKDPDLEDVIDTTKIYSFLKQINKQPLVTVYTCAFNEGNYIKCAMDSVAAQTIFKDIEYIIIDDASRDATYEKIISSKLFKDGRIKVKRNEKNIGLSSSSNIALNMARGKYIMRVDADDALLFPSTIENMVKKAKQDSFEALYPTYIDDASKGYLSGKDNHHVGGCLFLTKAIRNIQFTENLRGFEGLDLFERAKSQIKIGYYDDMPAFFYRNKPNSMSKTNEEYREKVKKNISEGKLGNSLVGAI